MWPCLLLDAQEIDIKGWVKGNALPQASVQPLLRDQILQQTTSGRDGRFQLEAAAAGLFTLRVEAAGFRPVFQPINVRPNGSPELQVRTGELSSRIENITVTAGVTALEAPSPDPAAQIYVRQDRLDANPATKAPGAAPPKPQ